MCDANVAESYAILRQQLQRKGKPIPEKDLWIAATAHAYGMTLFTRDQHFAHIDLVEVEFWK
jgi:tRNA(fMet)-specific endonuclease VapC